MQMLRAPGVELGEAPGASGPAPASHLAPCPCSSSLFFQRLVCRENTAGLAERLRSAVAAREGAWQCHPELAMSPSGGNVTQN